jgi:hypothetical protein
MSDLTFALSFTASAEITRPEHAEECLAAHPNQPCPGYPHTSEE